MTHLPHRRSLTISSAVAVILSAVAAGPAMAKITTATPRVANHYSTAGTMVRAVSGAAGVPVSVINPGAKSVPPRMRG